MSKNTPRLQEKFESEIVAKLTAEFGYSSVMQVPRLQKISLNQGVNGATQDKKLVDAAVEEMTMISGQKAVPTMAKLSISNFKLREGMPIGSRVTLRREKMWEFLDRLVSVALPRVRDFRGIGNKGFDGRGNYTVGVKEQIIFPEIEIDKIGRISGMNITFVTSANTDQEAFSLLKALGLPFQK
jgi:large subunit ribosomal protein L5